MAMAAWSANVVTSSTSSSVNGAGSPRPAVMTPTRVSSFMMGTPSSERERGLPCAATG